MVEAGDDGTRDIRRDGFGALGQALHTSTHTFFN
jgi:hypothetical protein